MIANQISDFLTKGVKDSHGIAHYFIVEFKLIFLEEN